MVVPARRTIRITCHDRDHDTNRDCHRGSRARRAHRCDRPPARVPRRAGGQERRPHYPRPAPSPGSGFRMLSWDVTPSTAAGCGRDRTCPTRPGSPVCHEPRRAPTGSRPWPAAVKSTRRHHASPDALPRRDVEPARRAVRTTAVQPPGTRRTGTGGQCPRTVTGEADSRSVGESPLPVTGTDRATAGTSTTERYRYDRAVPVRPSGTGRAERYPMRYRSYRTPVPGGPYRYAPSPGAGSPVPGTGDRSTTGTGRTGAAHTAGRGTCAQRPLSSSGSCAIGKQRRSEIDVAAAHRDQMAGRRTFPNAFYGESTRLRRAGRVPNHAFDRPMSGIDTGPTPGWVAGPGPVGYPT